MASGKQLPDAERASVIRLGSLSDASTIATIEAASFTVGAIRPLNEQAITERLAAQREYIILVAESDTGVIAHALCYPETECVKDFETTWTGV